MEPLLEVKNLKVQFHTDEGVIEAVRDVSFEIKRGETVAIVGESGCGKSVMARAILRIVPSPGRIVEGQVNYFRAERNIELTALEEKGAEIRAIRGADIAMIFQEPMATFSPSIPLATKSTKPLSCTRASTKPARRRKRWTS